jgi:hypothetical protein
MRCPCCRQPLLSPVPECPHCQFSFASAAQYFGGGTQLEFPLSDPAGKLGFRQKRKVCRMLLAMASVFPQLKFAAVLIQADAKVPFPAQAFWLFNGGALIPAQESGSLCRLVLLVLDAAQPRAICMVGYGLEPFIPPDALNRIAASAAKELQSGDPASAILQALAALRVELARVCQAMPRVKQPAQTESPVVPGEAEAFAY